MEPWLVSLAVALVISGLVALIQAATWSYQICENRRLDIERRLNREGVEL